MVDLHVDIHGTDVRIDAVVDTGFASGTGFGLKLPAQLSTYAKNTGTGYVTLADGSQVSVEFIPNARILKIEDYEITDRDIIPTIFMGSHETGTLGSMFLQRCIFHLDGPNNIASLDF